MAEARGRHAAFDSRATSAKLAAMTQELAIALAQINPTVGDVAGNLIKIRDARAKAAALKADLVVVRRARSSPAIRPRIWC